MTAVMRASINGSPGATSNPSGSPSTSINSFSNTTRSYWVAIGAPIWHSNFRSRVWLPALRATGLSGIRVHDHRHTAAALLVAEGAHPLVVKSHLGHSSITVTMDVYGHLFPSEVEELAHRLDARHRAAADSVVPLVRPIEAQPTSKT